MNLTKDVYEYLASTADDRTILNMLSTNKSFTDPNFFERIMRRKYPLLIKFKKDDETWKIFFLRMTYYISKIEEEYGIPYIPSVDYNPEITYKNKNLEGRYSIYSWMLFNAVKSNRIDIVELILNKNIPHLDISLPLRSAASRGYIDIVKLLTPHVTKLNLNKALRSASIQGHLTTVKYLIEKGADNLDEALRSAVYGKHLDIVKFLIEKGGKNLEVALINSASRGRRDVIEFLIKNNMYNIDVLKRALNIAREAEHTETIKLLERNILL